MSQQRSSGGRAQRAGSGGVRFSPSADTMYHSPAPPPRMADLDGDDDSGAIAITLADPAAHSVLQALNSHAPESSFAADEPFEAASVDVPARLSARLSLSNRRSGGGGGGLDAVDGPIVDPDIARIQMAGAWVATAAAAF